MDGNRDDLVGEAVVGDRDGDIVDKVIFYIIINT